MSTVSNVDNSVVGGTYNTTQTEKKSKVSGKQIGDPELSEKAKSYYDELKKKYSNMDFILVSKDKKEQAQSQAGNYANANRMVVLIDEEKIERMAEDESYRKQYEGIIDNASKQMPKLQSSLNDSSANVKTYGMQVNSNGTASFFAVVDKSQVAQKERIEKKALEKKAEKKAEERKTAKKEKHEEIEQKRSNKSSEDEDTIKVTASSIEELIKKIDDTVYDNMSNNVQTDSEKMVGQHIDLKM